MEFVPEHAPALLPRGDVFIDLSPRQLLSHERQALNTIYDGFRTAGTVPDVQKDVEKLWVLFDLAIETDHLSFILRYVDGDFITAEFLSVLKSYDLEICFSTELIPCGPAAVLHRFQVILDWCQKYQADAELQILGFRYGVPQVLPQKLKRLERILEHCASHQEGDPVRREDRNKIIERYMQTTRGLQLAALAANWMHSTFTITSPRRSSFLAPLSSESYLASQSLPLLWLEHYPFTDEVKMMEIVFLHKEYIGNEELKECKLAIFAFFMLHYGNLQSLDFLTDVFGIERKLAELWQGLFLTDLCSVDRHFQSPTAIETAVQSLQKATVALNRPVPIETLSKLHSLGRASEAKALFLLHLKTYLQMIANTMAVGKHGLMLCFSAGDVTSGLIVVRETVKQFRRTSDGYELLRYFFDLILGNGRLQDLVMQNLTGHEEAVFIDWAGNKRDDPECSLYLTLYFLKKSNIKAAHRLYHLNQDKIDCSMHKNLWQEVSRVLERFPTVHRSHDSMQLEIEHMANQQAPQSDEEMEEDMTEGVVELLRANETTLPLHLQHLLKRTQLSGSQLMHAFSESISSHNLCPLIGLRDEITALTSPSRNEEKSDDSASIDDMGGRIVDE